MEAQLPESTGKYKRTIEQYKQQNCRLWQLIGTLKERINDLKCERDTIKVYYIEMYQQCQELDHNDFSPRFLQLNQIRYRQIINSLDDKSLNLVEELSVAQFSSFQNINKNQSNNQHNQVSDQSSYNLTSSIDAQKYFPKSSNLHNSSQTVNRPSEEYNNQNLIVKKNLSSYFQYDASIPHNQQKEKENVSHILESKDLEGFQFHNAPIQEDIKISSQKGQFLNTSQQHKQFNENKLEDNEEIAFQNMLQNMYRDEIMKKQRQAIQIQMITMMKQRFRFISRDSTNRYYANFAQDIARGCFESQDQIFEMFRKDYSIILEKFIQKCIFDPKNTSPQFITKVLTQLPGFQEVSIYSQNYRVQAIEIQEFIQNFPLKNIKTVGIICYSIKVQEFRKILQIFKKKQFNLSIYLIEISKELLQLFKQISINKNEECNIRINQLEKGTSFQMCLSQNLEINCQVKNSQIDIQSKIGLLRRLVQAQHIQFRRNISTNILDYDIVFNNSIENSEITQFFAYEWKQIRSISFKHIAVDKQIWISMKKNRNHIKNVDEVIFNKMDFSRSQILFKLLSKTNLKMFQSLKTIKLIHSDQFLVEILEKDSSFQSDQLQLVRSNRQIFDSIGRRKLRKFYGNRSDGRKQEKRIKKYKKILNNSKQMKMEYLSKRYPQIRILDMITFQ